MSESEKIKSMANGRGRGKSIAMIVAVVFIPLTMLLYRPIIRRVWPIQKSTAATTDTKPQSTVTLAPGIPDAITVEPLVIERLGIKIAIATEATLPIDIKLLGTLSLDSTQLEQVRCRFDGEVVEIGKVADGSRQLQFGDSVKLGQLLAIVWSRELGEKKSELVDALSQQRLDTATRDRLASIAKTGAIPERELKELERAVETDRVAVSRIRRTLQTWRITPKDVAEVEAEASRLIGIAKETPSEVAEQWARAEVRAAIDGTILEQNVAVGNIVVPTDDLFKIANLSRLRVIASAYEEDLPRLDSVPSEERTWTITIPAEPNVAPILGSIEQIGKIIDPTQHTALVMGWVPNIEGRLRAGQFISVNVAFPSPGNEVVLPATAVIEKGGESFVFVVEGNFDATQPTVFARRSVSVSRQIRDQVCILISPPTDKKIPNVVGLKPGENVVTSGGVELQQTLMNLTAEKP